MLGPILFTGKKERMDRWPTVGVPVLCAKFRVLLYPSGHSCVSRLRRRVFPLRLVMINKAKEQMFCLARRCSGFPVLSQPCRQPDINIFAFKLPSYYKGSECKHSNKYCENSAGDGQSAPVTIRLAGFINAGLATENRTHSGALDSQADRAGGAWNAAASNVKGSNTASQIRAAIK